MIVVVNGKEIKTQSQSIMELINTLDMKLKYMALTQNGNIVSKDRWEKTTLSQNDVIDMF